MFTVIPINNHISIETNTVAIPIFLSFSFFVFIQVKNQFIDKLRIYAKGGSGGQGLPSYGGVGGKGGNVYVESSSKMTFRRLKNLHPSKRFKAKEGENSR